MNKSEMGQNLAIALGLLAASLSYAADVPDSRLIQVRGINVIGSGCPLNEFNEPSAAVNISEDAQAFTVAFDRYVAEQGPGIALSESRKNCNLTIDLHIPQGWQYSIFNVTYQGFTNLDPGLQALLRTQYRFQGGRAVILSDSLRGPAARDYSIEHKLGVESLVWSNCNERKSLNIATSVALLGSMNKRGLMTVDTIDGVFRQVYGIQWRRCQ